MDASFKAPGGTRCLFSCPNATVWDYYPMIYPYQEETYRSIRRAMAVHNYAQQLEMPIKPRTNVLLVGPTGSGKTHLAKAALKESNWGTYHINCSTWMVMGSRGDSHTLPELVSWVAKEPEDRPLAVFMDEIDKVGLTSSDWYRNVLSEMLSVLDHHIPPGVYDLGGVPGPEVEARFKRLFFIGCGAFQDLEDGPQTGLGFNPEDRSVRNLDKISQMLPRELTNRFSDKILRLPKLGHADYRGIVKMMYRASNAEVRAIIKRMAAEKVKSAVENSTGARFAETLAAEVIEQLLVAEQPSVWVDRKREQDLATAADLAEEDELWGAEIH